MDPSPLGPQRRRPDQYHRRPRHGPQLSMKHPSMRGIAALAGVLAAGLLGGCATHVAVLKAPPAAPYEVIGKVTYFQQDRIGFKEGALNEDPVEGLREKAAALGAD